jgi:hypothetical protein
MRRTLVLAATATLLAVGGAAGASAPSVVGHGDGRWHYVKPAVPDGAGHSVLHGHGTFGGKSATIRGRVEGLGFIAQGKCSVILHLTTSSGTTTIRGHSVKSYPGFSTCNDDFAFHYRSGQRTGHIKLLTAKQTTSHTRRFVLRLR